MHKYLKKVHVFWAIFQFFLRKLFKRVYTKNTKRVYTENTKKLLKTENQCELQTNYHLSSTETVNPEQCKE